MMRGHAGSVVSEMIVAASEKSVKLVREIVITIQNVKMG